ncbi:MAG: hypothetical protein NTV85_28625 [Hyphomicrobiales bacterium]|nr:hypothetical protein [Hyphomicrobiales bacterium]
MALVFGDSFDHYVLADILKKWSNVTYGSVLGDRQAISETYALPPHLTGFSMWDNKILEKTLATPLTTFIAGLWYQTASLASASIILAFMDSATPTNIHLSVRWDTSGHITLCRDATVLATSTNTLTINTWYHIEVKATIGDADGTYEVRVNGTATDWIPAATSKDTRNGGNATIGSVRIYGHNANTPGYARYQDFYILNTTGTQASDFLGPCRFAVIHPVGAGNSAQWAGSYADNWQNVASMQAGGDATFNQDSTAGHIDTFTMSDVPAGTIHAIQHVLYARQDAGAQRVIRPKTRIGGTNYSGVSVNTAASYLMFTEPVVFSPATGGATAFTDAEINGAEFGYELVS